MDKEIFKMIWGILIFKNTMRKNIGLDFPQG